MPVQHHLVQGDEVRLVVLPRYNRAAFEAWERFIDSDPENVYGLDVETTAIPMFEGAHKAFGPALALPEYVVPHDLPSAVYRRGYVAGERRKVTVRTIQFGTASEGWVLPVDGKWRKHIVAFLRAAHRRFVSHNAAFDAVRVWHEFHIDLGERSIDTLPMVNMRWPGRTAPFGGAGLKETCGYVLGDRGLLEAEDALHARFADLYGVRNGSPLPNSFIPGKSLCRNCKESTSWAGSLRGFCYDCYSAPVGYNSKVEEWGWDNIPLDDPVFLKYAGLDAVYVRRLLPALSKEIASRRMSALSRREQRIKRLMVKTSTRGLRIDKEWTANAKAEVQAEFDAASDEVVERTGHKARSSYLRTDWLAKHGCKTTSLDKNHLPLLLIRFDEDEEVGPVLRAYQRVMRNANLLTNLTTILRHGEGGSGRVHPNINTMQAHTARMSITNPAMQTLAKSEEKGRILRGCFIADDGFVIVGADYDNQEIRIGAALSGDEALLDIIASGVSQHERTARGIYPDFIDKHQSPLQYHRAKTLDFAQQYGAMPKKIAATLGISVPEAYDLWVAWRTTYAGLVRWTDEQAEKKYIVNPFGRVIPADPFRSYANGNYMIQSTGRDVLGKAMESLADAGWGDTFWLPVHDELEIVVPEDKAEEAAAALTEHMTMYLPGYDNVVIPAEGEIIGERWRGL
jgi:DNA polymerase-1